MGFEMSQRRGKRKSDALSQGNRSRLEPSQGPSSQRNEEMHNLSLEELTKKCVRFLLTKMASNIAIKRTEIIQYVFHERPGKNFDPVLQNAIRQLKQVYGLDVDVIDDTSNKKYFVTNCLPYAHLIPRSEENNMKSVITFLVLTHIFMSQNKSLDSELWQFLKELDIAPESNIKGVGNVKEFVKNTLVKQHFVYVDDKDSENEQKKVYYMWGSRADETVSKKSILKFVCDIYGTPDIKFWNDQYKQAREQFAGQKDPTN